MQGKSSTFSRQNFGRSTSTQCFRFKIFGHPQCCQDAQNLGHPKWRLDVSSNFGRVVDWRNRRTVLGANIFGDPKPRVQNVRRLSPPQHAGPLLPPPKMMRISSNNFASCPKLPQRAGGFGNVFGYIVGNRKARAISLTESLDRFSHYFRRQRSIKQS